MNDYAYAHDGGIVRRWYTLVENVVEISVFEEGMTLDIFGIILARA